MPQQPPPWPKVCDTAITQLQSLTGLLTPPFATELTHSQDLGRRQALSYVRSAISMLEFATVPDGDTEPDDTPGPGPPWPNLDEPP